MIPDPLQLQGVDWILDRPKSALWWRPGSVGKTYPTLLAIWELMQLGEINRVLIASTKYVAETIWTAEIQKVKLLRQALSISVAVGTAEQRIAALNSGSDIVTINNENIKWLVQYLNGGRSLQDIVDEVLWPFDMVVIDETSKYSNPDAVKKKYLSTVLGQIQKFVGLTGSPRPQNLLQIWAQVYLLDRGERLGSTYEWFRDRFFNPPTRWSPYIWTPRKGAPELIYGHIADICFVAEPKRTNAKPRIIDVPIKLSSRLQKQYEKFTKDKCLEWEKDIDNEIFDGKTASVLRGKLVQFANGMVYNEEKEAIPIHDLKIERLKEMVAELQGSPVLIAYHFRYDKIRLAKAFPNAVFFASEHYDAWNRGEIPIMFIHPATGAHGLNLQISAYNLIFILLPDSFDNYDQLIKRLDRRGQKRRVVVQRLITQDTVEEAIVESLACLGEQQQYLFTYMCKLVARHLKKPSVHPEIRRFQNEAA